MSIATIPHPIAPTPAAAAPFSWNWSFEGSSSSSVAFSASSGHSNGSPGHGSQPDTRRLAFTDWRRLVLGPAIPEELAERLFRVCTLWAPQLAAEDLNNHRGPGDSALDALQRVGSAICRRINGDDQDAEAFGEGMDRSVFLLCAALLTAGKTAGSGIRLSFFFPNYVFALLWYPFLLFLSSLLF